MHFDEKLRSSHGYFAVGCFGGTCADCLVSRHGNESLHLEGAPSENGMRIIY